MRLSTAPRNIYGKLPSLEKDSAVLKFISEDKEKYSPQNDQELCVSFYGLCESDIPLLSVEEETFVGKVFGIITVAKECYFMECSLDDQEKLRFKLLKP
ncbi:hypothetical protein RCL_jg7062.t1 [Rhizophagus clarus]|uniref:Uncharacterized protein n=1 Tax=Rhizophagus clarus TaxID=94130 RepID=A0A8H3M612_9GLOM|nr:hypothetical protein RCL_jg7062.t1 [Rhizophagus clarus]